MEMSPRIPRCFRIAQTLENVLMVFYARYMSDAVLEQSPNERESYAGSYTELIYATLSVRIYYDWYFRYDASRVSAAVMPNAMDGAEKRS